MRSVETPPFSSPDTSFPPKQQDVVNLLCKEATVNLDVRGLYVQVRHVYQITALYIELVIVLANKTIL